MIEVMADSVKQKLTPEIAWVGNDSQPGSIGYDNGFFVGVKVSNREFQVKGAVGGGFALIEVGIGANRIGFANRMIGDFLEVDDYLITCKH